MVQMHSNSAVRKSRKYCAGDIAAAVGLKDVTTGDTLCCNQRKSDHCWSAWSSPSR